MFKNIGKTIRVLAIVLAALTFLGFVALGTLSLLAALQAGISEELQLAGMQAAIICYVLGILTPALTLILYGFGSLISAAKVQAENAQRTQEMLRAALSDGMLSEEIARKSAQAQAKLLAHVMSQMPAAEKPVQKNTQAPRQRFVSEIATESTEAPAAEPVEEAAPAFIPVQQVPVQEVAVQEASNDEATAEEAAPAPAFIPVTTVRSSLQTPAPFQAPTPATPTAGASVLKPFSGDEETF
jgi:hypothetical protein